MPIFKYKALSAGGRKVSGVVDADSLALVKERLRRDAVMVTSLVQIEKRPRKRELDGNMLLTFTRELGQLLSAGLPLYEGLLTIEEKYQRHRAHTLFLDLCDRLKSGEQLSEILSRYPKSFDSVYIAMVRAGESTGSLPWVFEQLHLLIERRQKLKKQLISAMAYPAFLGCFCFLVIIGLFLFVIPSMQELFEGRQLHPLTESVLFISIFIQNHFFSLALLIASSTFAAIWLFKKKANLVHHWLLHVPIVKTILLQAALIRFCRSTSVLLFGGVPLVNALALARGTMKNPPLEAAILSAEARIIEGESLSQELKKSPYIPKLVTRMLSLAEETGKMAQSLQKISEIYDIEMERNLDQVTTFLQPALLLILGGVVGLVILSILLPLTDVSSLIGN
ncbi:MAG: Type II secretion system protein F [Chlamydiae bacterium]|nr:Type II secretion system protein F [Chlamydiota bacterium]